MNRIPRHASRGTLPMRDVAGRGALPGTMTRFDNTVPARGISNIAAGDASAGSSELALPLGASAASRSEQLPSPTEPPGALAHTSTVPASRSSLLGAAPAEPSAMRVPVERRRAGSSAELWVQVTLCVVVALLLLAVIALPKRMDARSESAPELTAYELFSNLQKLRAAVGEYRLDHGVWPGAPVDGAEAMRASAASRELVRQLTEYSDLCGETSERAGSDHPFGPYLETRVPVNPVVGLASVHVLGESEEWPATPDESTGWIYRPTTGEVRANCRGAVSTSALRYYDL
jgi:hypothetical protein